MHKLAYDQECQGCGLVGLTPCLLLTPWCLLAGLFKKGSGKSAAMEVSQGAAESEACAEAAGGQTGQQGVCGILGQGRVYVGSSCMVDACSAMYQQIGIQVKWGEQASPHYRVHRFYISGVHLIYHASWQV